MVGVIQMLTGLLLAAPGLAREVPDNLRALYDNIRERGDCRNKLASGFWNTDDSSDGEYKPKTRQRGDLENLALTPRQASPTAPITCPPKT
jgi:hypothetical protein